MDKVPPSLVTSIVSTLTSKIKCHIFYPKKNKLLAERLLPLYNLISEQLIPQFVLQNVESYTVINQLQHLVYLLSQKVQQTFQSSIIRCCLDQNLALKALKQVTLRLFEMLQISGVEKFCSIIDTQVKNQNQHSQACITSFISYIRSPKKLLVEDELSILMETYETTLQFVAKDIDKYRRQRTPIGCFMTLYPWVYDIDTIDLQMTMNNDLTPVICSYLKRDAQVFWLSNFKCQATVTADEFFFALRELTILAHMHDHYEDNAYLYEQVATQNSAIAIRDHAELISTLIRNVSRAISCGTNLNVLVSQIKTYVGKVVNTDLVKEIPDKYKLSESPDLSAFKGIITGAKLIELSAAQSEADLELSNAHPRSKGKQKNDSCLVVTIVSADAAENKGVSFTYDGSISAFKFGEGDSAHYQLPNDKKLWDSQLQFICDKEGNYFVRDCARLHPTRLKLEGKLSVQIQKGTVIDFGNYLQYHFDRVTQDLPFQKPNDSLLIRHQTKPEQPTGEDFPCLRARALWANKMSEGDQAKIQKELIVEAGDYSTFTLGRGPKCDIPIRISKLSNQHCTIKFRGSQGWQITESENQKPSTTGTYIYLKSLSQIIEQEPSNLIPIHSGMVLSLINYDIKLEIIPAIHMLTSSESIASLIQKPVKIKEKKAKIVKEDKKEEKEAPKPKQPSFLSKLKELLAAKQQEAEKIQAEKAEADKAQAAAMATRLATQKPLMVRKRKTVKINDQENNSNGKRIIQVVGQKLQRKVINGQNIQRKIQVIGQNVLRKVINQQNVFGKNQWNGQISDGQDMAGPEYDAQGSMTSPQYDAEGKLISSEYNGQGFKDGEQYDADGKLVSSIHDSEEFVADQEYHVEENIDEPEYYDEEVVDGYEYFTEEFTNNQMTPSAQLTQTDQLLFEAQSVEAQQQALEAQRQAAELEAQLLEMEQQIMEAEALEAAMIENEDINEKNSESKNNKDSALEQNNKEASEQEEDQDKSQIAESNSLVSEDDEPVLILPNLEAIQADRDCLTRLMLIENTEHTCMIDEGDQYSLRKSICVSDACSMRKSVGETLATVEVQRLKKKLAEAIQRKMQQHTSNLAMSKRDNMHTREDLRQLNNSSETMPLQINESFFESSSIAELRIQLQEAEAAQAIARQASMQRQNPERFVGANSDPNIQVQDVMILRDESVQTSQQYNNGITSGYSINEKQNKQPEISLPELDSKWNKSIQQGISELPTKQTDLSKTLHMAGNNSAQLNVQLKSKSWLDTDTLYSQKYLSSTQKRQTVFPKEDEKHTNFISDSD